MTNQNKYGYISYDELELDLYLVEFVCEVCKEETAHKMTYEELKARTKYMVCKKCRC